MQGATVGRMAERRGFNKKKPQAALRKVTVRVPRR